MSEKSQAGLTVLLLKLAPKLWPIIVKLHDALWAAVKSLFGIKGAGLVGSAGLYTYLFTWQMGIALVVFIGIHEYGHVWAMKRCGIKTRGMFFVPGFGAVAVADEQFKSARNEAYIAILGPWASFLLFILPALAVYGYTQDPLWVVIAGFMAFINLINLFPVNPLDGGRILKALAYSDRHAASLATTTLVSFVTTVLGAMSGFFLMMYMALLGLYETAKDFGILERINAFMRSLTRVAVGFGLYVLSFYALWDENTTQFWQIVTVLAMIVLSVMAGNDIWSSTVEKGRHIVTYPFAIIRDAGTGIMQVLRLRSDHVKPIENYIKMGAGGKVWYATCYLGLTLLHVIVIILSSKTPGAEFFTEMLK